jgi:hypothetical protein
MNDLCMADPPAACHCGRCMQRSRLTNREVAELETALRRIRDHGQTHEEPCWKITNGDCADVMREIARSVIGDRP